MKHNSVIRSHIRSWIPTLYITLLTPPKHRTEPTYTVVKFNGPDHSLSFFPFHINISTNKKAIAQIAP